MIQSIKGTRDFYPEQKRIQNFIFDSWKVAALKFGFEEMDGPILEPSELWAAKGDELGEQLYTFKDKGGRQNVLRPEMTPTVARMVATQKGIPKPIKWFSIQRLFRYEAPQKGRLREHWQLNADILGSNDPMADAEVIGVAITALLKLGLTKEDFYVRINSRELLEKIMQDLGIKNTTPIFRIIDKKEKVSVNEFNTMLKTEGLNTKQINSLIKILEIKKFSELPECEETNYLKQVFINLKFLGYGPFIKLDLSIARGLSYYTKTVFEAFDKKGKFRALCGGGRYDNLVSKYSEEKIPGVGFGMGDATIELILQDRNKLPETKTSTEYFVAVADAESRIKALEITGLLRQKYNVELNIANRSLGKQIAYAASKGIPKVVVVGKKDLEKEEITIRTMADGKQKMIKLTKLDKI